MTELEMTLLAIASAEKCGEVDDELREQIHLILDDASLEFADAVPPWLVQFFVALAQRQTLPVTDLPATDDEQGEVWEFFGYLQAIAPFDCYDFGEWIRVRLPQLGMLGLVSIEHSYFRVLPLADAEAVGGPGDLADAVKLDRPA